MALTILKLPVEQSPISSLIGGFQTGQDIRAQSYKNQEARDNAAYLPQALKTAQNTAMAKLQGMQIQNQFMPNMLSAKTAALQTQAQYGDALDQARLQSLQLNNTLAPQRLALLNAQLQQAQGRQNYYQSAPYQYSKLAQSVNPAVKAVMADKYAPNILNAANQVWAQGVTASPSQAPATTTPSGMTLPQDQATLVAMQKAAQLSANRAVTTNATNRQQEGATQVESLISSPNFQKGMEASAAYAGAAGKGKEFLDRWTDSNQDRLVAAQTFQTQTTKLLENRIRTLDQMGATDQQTATLAKLFTTAQDDYSSNPKRYLASMQKFTTALRDVESSVNKSANKVYTNPGGTNDVPMENVLVISPSGQAGHIPQSQLQQALQAGYKMGQ